jgi:hypothetical protein
VVGWKRFFRFLAVRIGQRIVERHFGKRLVVERIGDVEQRALVAKRRRQRLVIGRLVIGRLVIGRLVIGRLVVGRLVWQRFIDRRQLVVG